MLQQLYVWLYSLSEQEVQMIVAISAGNILPLP